MTHDWYLWAIIGGTIGALAILFGAWLEGRNKPTMTVDEALRRPLPTHNPIFDMRMLQQQVRSLHTPGTVQNPSDPSPVPRHSPSCGLPPLTSSRRFGTHRLRQWTWYHD